MATATRSKKTQSQQPPASPSDSELPFYRLKIDPGQVPPELACDANELNAGLAKAEATYSQATTLRDIDVATVTSVELSKERQNRQEGLLRGLQDCLSFAESALDVITRSQKAFQKARKDIADDEVKTRKRIRERLLKDGYSESTGQSANQLSGIINSHPDTVAVRKRVQELIGKSRAAADAAHQFRKYIAAITRDLSQLADDWRLGNAVK